MSCLTPLLHPQQWWWVSLMGLTFPFLLFVVIAFLVGWLVLLKFRLALLSLSALLLGYKSIGVFIAFNAPAAFEVKKDSKSIRVVSWNVARFIELTRNNNRGSVTRKKMLALLAEQKADVLCLQEFYTSDNPAYYDNLSSIRKQLDYPYYYFSKDLDGDLNYYSSVIFSRYPIVDSGMVRFPRPSQPEVLLQADIQTDGGVIRVFTTHLQSQRFNKQDYLRIEKIRDREDSLFYHFIPIVGKLKKGVVIRSLQADMIASLLADSPHPVILAADLNDVPNSYTYFTVRGTLQDAFLQQGYGLGRTFRGLSPTLRIDYIFADQRFAVQQFKRVKKDYSDHYMLVTDLQLQP
ncbi:MAG: endonuclease/exonuclease/phosphatase [Chitinophagia bacterium]|nr:endonuclease/exonuclease/phosphatase [Chitinophagia bacterium]